MRRKMARMSVLLLADYQIDSDGTMSNLTISAVDCRIKPTESVANIFPYGTFSS
jgi:hypothetical protein